MLDGQNCVLELRQMGSFLYLTLTADETKICDSHVCQSGEPIPVWNTPTFSGRLVFQDDNGKLKAPQYDGLSDRYTLYYVTAEEWQELTA